MAAVVAAVATAAALTAPSTIAPGMGRLSPRPVHAQRPTSTIAPTASPKPTAVPPPTATPADPAAPPADAGSLRRAARVAYVPRLGDVDDRGGAGACDVVVAALNAGDVPSKLALVTWPADGSGEPHLVECSGVLRPGAVWRFGHGERFTGGGAVFSLATDRVTDVAPDSGVNDLIGDYLCEHLFFQVIGDAADYVRFRDAFVAGGVIAGVPLERAGGGAVAVSVERTCGLVPGDAGVLGVSEYGGTSLEASLGAWSPALGRYRYALPALHGAAPDGSGPRSQLVVQNAGTAHAVVEVRLAGAGAECEPSRPYATFTLAPGASASPAAVLPPGTTAGWILGTQPLAVAVEARDVETISAYEGASAPLDDPDAAVPASTGTLLHVPLAPLDADGWHTTLQLQNTSPEAAAKVLVSALDDAGDLRATSTVWVCPAGHATVDVRQALDLAPGTRGPLRIESLAWQAPDAGMTPPSLAVVVEVARRGPSDATHDGEAGAYLVTGPQADRFTDGAAALALPDVAAPAAAGGPVADVVVMNAVIQPGRTSAILGFGAAAGLDHRLGCLRLNERATTTVRLVGRAAGEAGFRGAALVSAASWDHWAFGGAAGNRNTVGLALAAIERPAGSMAADGLPDADAPGDVTRLQGGIPLRRDPADAGVATTADGFPLAAVCAPAGTATPDPAVEATPTARASSAPGDRWPIYLPVALAGVTKPPTAEPLACDPGWRIRLAVAADGGADLAGGVAPCNGRADAPDAVAALACPLPAVAVRIVRPSDGAVLWSGPLARSPSGAGAVLDVVLCAPPPYLLSLAVDAGGPSCWRLCPGSAADRSLAQADFDAASPGVPAGSGRSASLAWHLDRSAPLAASQGPPLVYLPVLGFFGEADVCVAQLTAQNVGAEPSKAVLVTWGEPGRCPPSAGGPLKVECSGLIRPGDGWRFTGPQIPTGSKSGYVLSLTTKSLAEIGVDLGEDDIVADRLCEELFFNVFGDADDERRFRFAYLRGDVFAGVPLHRAYGGPLAVHVERACPADGVGGAPVAVDGYLAPSHRDVDARPAAAAEFRTPLPALGADDTLRAIVHVQNAGLTCGDVEVRYQSGNGTARCAAFALAPGEARSVDIAACLAAGAPGAGLASPGVGWAIGTAPLAVVVDLAGRGAATLASYAAGLSAATAAGADAVADRLTTLVAPVVLGSTPSAPYRARLFVQNLDPAIPATVDVMREGRDGRVRALPMPDDVLVLDPGAGAVVDIPPDAWPGQLMVWSLCPDDCLRIAPIAAVLVQWRQPGGGATAQDAVADVLTPAGRPTGAIRHADVGVTRLAIPTLGKAFRSGLPTEVGARSSRLALANRVVKPGFTDLVVYVYDQNGLLDYVCQKLNERQTDIIDLDTWGFVNNGFLGSALVSAWFWEHDVFDAEGHWVRNHVDLDAAFGALRAPSAEVADATSLTHAQALSPDFPLAGTVVPLCGGRGPDPRPLRDVADVVVGRTANDAAPAAPASRPTLRLQPR